jgi:hypothetical protein
MLKKKIPIRHYFRIGWFTEWGFVVATGERKAIDYFRLKVQEEFRNNVDVYELLWNAVLV